MSKSRLTNVVWTIVSFAIVLAGPMGLRESSTFAQDRHSDYSNVPVGNSTREARDVAVRGIPYHQLNAASSTKIKNVVDHSSYFRRMPKQTLECEPEMFQFLVRNPEVIVGIWDVMGITKVSLKRINQYQLQGNDGAGTTCKMDLVFGNDSSHVYYVTGGYKGNLWPKELTGQSVIVLHHQATKGANGLHHVTVTMDVFLKLENIGADLVVRTLGPLVSKSADYNFVECAAFVSQVSQVAVRNPQGIQNLGMRLTSVDPKVREQFLQMAQTISDRNARIAKSNAVNVTPSGYSVEEALEPEPIRSTTTVPPAEQRVAKTERQTVLGMAPETVHMPKPISTRKSANSEPVPAASDSPTIQKLNRDSPNRCPNN